MWGLYGALAACALIWLMASVRLRRSLSERLESLIKEGMAILEEFSETRSSVRYELSVPPADMARVAAFENRVRALLTKERPSALRAYADAGNSSLGRARARSDDDASRHAMKTLIAAMRKQPSVELEARLDGLVAVLEQLRRSERAG